MIPEQYRLVRPVARAWRSPGVLQIGLDADGLVLHGVPGQLADAVDALRQSRSLADLDRLLPALGTSLLEWFLHQLAGHGLLEPATEPGDQPTLGIAVVGSGGLADDLCSLLHRSLGIAPTRIASSVPPTSARPHHSGNYRASPVLHWSAQTQSWPELTIVATETQEPDRALTDALLRADRAHLVTRLEPARAVVGPLVIPGRTPCVRCHDLLRCRYDPAWPRLVAQLCAEPAPIDPALQSWAVATTVAQVRCQLGGGTPDVTGRTLELGVEQSLHTREWPAHPECGCLLVVA